MFARAGQPELVRSNQKDVYYLGFLREGVGQIYRNVRGTVYMLSQFLYLNIVCSPFLDNGYELKSFIPVRVEICNSWKFHLK